MTATLPLRPGFTGARLDRADHLRRDEALPGLLADPAATLLRLDGLEPVLSSEGLLDWGPLADAPEGVPLAFLGLMDGSPRFVALAPAGHPARRSALLNGLLDRWPREEAATYGTARCLVDWHARHRFCANCGTASETFRAGWARKCPNCRAEHFPRTDPVVIMLAEHDGRILLGRQAAWAAGRYSALAGFLEPGESVEEAVAREIFEEAGVRVADVRYVTSQPWPFPSQLMIACVARADDPTIRLDQAELEDAMWVDRAGVRAALSGAFDAPFGPPPPYAIAHTLLSWWVEQDER